MKISLQWLKEYVDYNDSVERLEEIMTDAGFEIEDSFQVGDDWMLDIEITSNRPDCLGHIGLAREVAAATGGEFKMPKIKLTEAGKDINDLASVQNDEPELCGRYTARVINNVTICDSPDWMKQRLETIGLRSINNIVDITNYVLMEIGQPLHAFDYEHLKDGKVIVRLAKEGETLETIDHSKQELDDKMLLIADSEKPVALAGVMGGADSEVTDKTTSILLESAHFAPLSIRRTARALVMGSDSSFRFERNVDIEMVEWASRRAAGLLSELAGGKVQKGVIDCRSKDNDEIKTSLRISRLNKLIGIDFDSKEVISILSRLGFAPDYDGSDTVNCIVPSWRRCDVYREADLIEEVVRIHGFDDIPIGEKIHIRVTTANSIQKSRQKVRQSLIGCGFFETINVSFLQEKYLSLFAPKDFQVLRVKSNTRKSDNALRPTLLPSLLDVRKRNQDAGNSRCDIYELATVWKDTTESTSLGILTDGNFRELRGSVEAIIAGLDKQAELICKPTEIMWAEEGSAAELIIDGTVIGQGGCASKEILKAFDLNEGVCICEIDFAKLIKLEGRIPQLKPLMRFPAIVRDLSLLLDDAISWEDIEAAIKSSAIEEMQSVNFIEIYRGKGIEKGKKSLTLSIEFRRPEETLTHETVDGYQKQIIDILDKKFQATLRQ